MDTVTLLLSFLLILGQPVTVPNQEAPAQERDPYEPIPASQRESLKQAVEKLVAAETQRDWQTVWELYDRRPEETKESFLQRMKLRRRLRVFQVLRISFYPPEGSWTIDGCACFQEDKAGKGVWASVTAKWKDTRWYLSPVAIGLFGSEKAMNVRECSIPSQSPTTPKPQPPTEEASVSFKDGNLRLQIPVVATTKPKQWERQGSLPKFFLAASSAGLEALSCRLLWVNPERPESGAGAPGVGGDTSPLEGYCAVPRGCGEQKCVS